MKGQTFEFHFDFHYIFPTIQVLWNLWKLQGSLYYKPKQCMIITINCHTFKHFGIKFDHFGIQFDPSKMSPIEVSPLWRFIIDPSSLPAGTLIGSSSPMTCWFGWSDCAQLNKCVSQFLTLSKRFFNLASLAKKCRETICVSENYIKNKVSILPGEYEWKWNIRVP